MRDDEFTFDLMPLEGEEALPPVEEHATSIILTSGGDVLVVEDDPINSRGQPALFRAALKPTGTNQRVFCTMRL